jgi:hypothetical protein
LPCGAGGWNYPGLRRKPERIKQSHYTYPVTCHNTYLIAYAALDHDAPRPVLLQKLRTSLAPGIIPILNHGSLAKISWYQCADSSRGCFNADQKFEVVNHFQHGAFGREEAEVEGGFCEGFRMPAA